MINPTPSLAALQQLTHPEMQRVNEVITTSFAQHVALIADISNHIIKSGGKRLRPVLTIACAKLLEYDGDRHIGLAAAVELIHTATLLHDDVVDESTMRRGEETANAVWSNQASVLVGDFLLSRAFQTMVADGSLEVLRLLSDASAIISQGEVKQLMATGDMSITREIYLDIIQSKTAVLFSAACEIAPIITAHAHLQTVFREFGMALGMAFQLVDDALDYSASSETLGKAVGDDLREGKLTLPVIEAYALCNATERAFFERVFEHRLYQEGDVETAITILTQYDTLQTTKDLAASYITKAQGILDTLGGEPAIHAALHDCLRFCIARGY